MSSKRSSAAASNSASYNSSKADGLEEAKYYLRYNEFEKSLKIVSGVDYSHDAPAKVIKCDSLLGLLKISDAIDVIEELRSRILFNNSKLQFKEVNLRLISDMARIYRKLQMHDKANELFKSVISSFEAVAPVTSAAPSTSQSKNKQPTFTNEEKMREIMNYIGLYFNHLMVSKEFSQAATQAMKLVELAKTNKALFSNQSKIDTMIGCIATSLLLQATTGPKSSGVNNNSKDITGLLTQGESMVRSIDGKEIDISAWKSKLLQLFLIEREDYTTAIKESKERGERKKESPVPLPDDQTTFIAKGFDIPEFDLFHLVQLYRYEARNLDQLLAILKDLIVSYSSDNWAYWEQYIHFSFFGFYENKMNVESLPNYVEAVKIKDFILEVQSKNKDGEIRGPFLALVAYEHSRIVRLEMMKSLGINKELTSDGAIQEAYNQFRGALEAYFGKFDSKQCCIFDVRNYLTSFSLVANKTTGTKPKSLPPGIFLNSAISQSKRIQINNESKLWDPLEPSILSVKVDDNNRKALVDFLNKRASDCATKGAFGDSNASKGGDKKMVGNLLRSFIFSHQALRMIGEHEPSRCSDSELQKLVQKLVSVYEKTQWLNLGNQGGQREVQAGDDILLLASHMLVDLAFRSIANDSSSSFTDPLPNQTFVAYLTQASALLAHGLKESPYNFQIALLSIEVFSYLGVYRPIPDLFKVLRIKSIQTDSLSYVSLADASLSGFYKDTENGCDTICGYSAKARRELDTLVAQALETGNYPAVVEQYELEERLSRSHQLASAKVDKVIVDLVRFATNNEKEQSFGQRKIVEYLDVAMDKKLVAISPISLGSLLSQYQSGSWSDLLCDNYDFDAQITWDCAYNATGDSIRRNRFDQNSLGAPYLKINRHLVTSAAYRRSWRQRATAFIELKLNAAYFIHTALKRIVTGGGVASAVNSYAKIPNDLATALKESFKNVDNCFQLFAKESQDQAIKAIKPTEWLLCLDVFRLMHNLLIGPSNAGEKSTGDNAHPNTSENIEIAERIVQHVEQLQSEWNEHKIKGGKILSRNWIYRLSENASYCLVWVIIGLRSIGSLSGSGNSNATASGGANANNKGNKKGGKKAGPPSAPVASASSASTSTSELGTLLKAATKHIGLYLESINAGLDVYRVAGVGERDKVDAVLTGHGQIPNLIASASMAVDAKGSSVISLSLDKVHLNIFFSHLQSIMNIQNLVAGLKSSIVFERST